MLWYCDNCGNEFEIDFFDSDLDYNDCTCSHCGTTHSIPTVDLMEAVDMEGFYGGSESGMSDFCRACGNSANYPDCVDSCSIMED